MEVLQKVTLYDFLGYTVPGGILTFIFLLSNFDKELFVGENASLSLVVIICIVAGYVVGQISSMLMSIVNKKMFKGNPYDYFEKDKGYEGIDCRQLKSALIKAKISVNTEDGNVSKMIRTYRSYMYAILQTDDRYNRLYNYSAMELNNKNMVVTCAFGGFLFPNILSTYAGCLCPTDLKILIIFVGLYGARLFYYHGWELYISNNRYIATWFIQKMLLEDKKK